MQMETNLTIELVKMLLTAALGAWLIAHTFENKWVNGFMKFIGVTQVAKPIVIFGGAAMTYLGVV